MYVSAVQHKRNINLWWTLLLIFIFSSKQLFLIVINVSGLLNKVLFSLCLSETNATNLCPQHKLIVQTHTRLQNQIRYQRQRPVDHPIQALKKVQIKFDCRKRGLTCRRFWWEKEQTYVSSASLSMFSAASHSSGISAVQFPFDSLCLSLFLTSLISANLAAPRETELVLFFNFLCRKQI